MNDLEYRQMLAREKAVADSVKIEAGKISEADMLKDAAFNSLRDAERRMHKYACSLEVGDERTKAFEIYENIRNAARVG